MLLFKLTNANGMMLTMHDQSTKGRLQCLLNIPNGSILLGMKELSILRDEISEILEGELFDDTA